MPDIEKQLKDIQQEPPSKILSKYKNAFGITDEWIESAGSSMNRMTTDQQLGQFDEFLKKILLRYKDIKKHVVAMMENKSDQLNYNRLIFMGMAKYEERGFNHLSERPELQL